MAQKRKYFTIRAMTVLFACVLLVGCSGTQAQKADVSYGYDEINDPMEGFNRAMFSLNDALDQALMRPVAKGYRAVVPQLARDGVRNFLRNLRSPINIANQVLQGDVEGAAHDLSRMVINTSIGIGGLFDVAKDTGLEYEQEDFGQTMATWGVGHGAYMILPFFGPSSVRDGIGIAVDVYADPVRLYLHNTDQNEWYYARVALTGLDKREELLDVLDDLRRNSIDYYAAMRSAYHQRREAMVNDQDPDFVAGPAIPDYGDEEW